ncbi:MAG: XRE family transcriptional regulator [Treponema sp. GWB1_62_6]|nr:MAG: XRE family transcriptional regulator [Treponema sp. GWA1_62_8]OHE64726.1 MAG: XRE family transcriptional regulator [Treponema sp. GWC1_61_84]OHE67750.1 MAG: XRE family transcriptional regulator [Treponema sp. GWB1_62_6]OHE75633.1 MAG: XRE family transcriptional regulator [Treponema sp. RIFOXYC1_FULL_61_9]HCM27564.1 XRE family transcriptional regulator [Treponema sp.]
MEFNEKLQRLRAETGMTQEQMAEKLFVSRVTVSKWESGRGYPNIESLKLMAGVLSVSIDDLLSGEELITIAERQVKESTRGIRSVVFGVLDVMMTLLLVLPLFGNDLGDRVAFVALPGLSMAQPYIVSMSYAVVIAAAMLGVLQLALQNSRNPVWLRLELPVSCSLSVFAVLFFIMTRQPYVSSFALCLLLCKGILLIKRR